MYIRTLIQAIKQIQLIAQQSRVPLCVNVPQQGKGWPKLHHSSTLTNPSAVVLLHKEGHLTELLLIKMTDDWRRALANNKTVRIILLTTKKRFIPYSSGLLQELQGIKIARDILLWMKDDTVNSSNSNILNTMRNTLKHTLPLFLNCLFFLTY